VTYAGDSSSSTQISHSLGSTPGFIVCKRTSTSGGWAAYHASLGTGKYLSLNGTHDAVTDSAFFPEVTDGFFRPGSDNDVNGSGFTYVAYLFASDAGGFGDDGSESIIKCGSYVGDGTSQEIDLGWEAQFVIAKRVSVTGIWYAADSMRGEVTLAPNSANAEDNNPEIEYTARGFKPKSNLDTLHTYIYIAIRRPMKTPESGTEVFGISEGGTTSPGFISSFPVDAAIGVGTDASNHYLSSRLTNKNYMLVTSTAAEAANSYFSYTFQNGYYDSTSGATELAYMFKRATGFFDVVAYTGDGTYDGSYNVNHNLTVAPEIIIAKSRSDADYWSVYHTGLTSDTYQINMNLTGAQLNTGQSWGPISTTFKPQYAGNANYSKNHSGRTYIAYLFATLAGVSKVGSYTGTGADLNVDCGFSAGARFILIKRTDDTGDWYVWDSVRGIVAGNDPYLLLNTTAAQVTNTDYIDPLSSGFTVTSSAPAALNASGGTYIFLAIA
jgi:hypothetical protein